MDSFELKPPLFNISSIIFLIAAIIVSAILGTTVFPKAFALYQAYPSDLTGIQVLVGISVAISITWSMFFLSILTAKSREIKVENNLVYFMKRSKFGFGKWTIDRIIDFSKITDVKERQKSVFNGKTTVILFWLIFHSKNGDQQEILLNGWDMQSMKNLFFYVRGKYPSIKLNTIVLKDSPEKLSGIDQLLKKA